MLIDNALHRRSCAAGCQHRFYRRMYVWINSSHCCTIGTSARPNLAATRFTTAVRTFALWWHSKGTHISSPKRRRRTVPLRSIKTLDKYWLSYLPIAQNLGTSQELKIAYTFSLISCNVVTMVTNQGPDKGEWGQCPGTALLVKRRNSKWSFTNEPEVSFRFRFYILIKVGPTVRPGVTSRLAKCPGISLQWIFKSNSSLMMPCYEIIPSWKA